MECGAEIKLPGVSMCVCTETVFCVTKANYLSLIFNFNIRNKHVTFNIQRVKYSDVYGGAWGH